MGALGATLGPLVFFGLAAFLLVRTTRRLARSALRLLGEHAVPGGLAASRLRPARAGFGAFEWMVRTARIRAPRAALIFPILCAWAAPSPHALARVAQLEVGVPIEVTTAPLGILGMLVGWGRWLELRLPPAKATFRDAYGRRLMLVGLLLIFYREA